MASAMRASGDGRHPAARAIASHCARRCSLPWFLTLDKPETLSDNDVRPLTPKADPRKGQKSHKLLLIALPGGTWGVPENAGCPRKSRASNALTVIARDWASTVVRPSPRSPGR